MRLPLLALLVLLSSCTQQASTHPNPAHGIVVSASQNASTVGAQVMQRGGNAVDAAVATAFALAVTFPEAGNIGGGGFMLIHFPDGRPPVFVDYRETAPAAVDARTFFRKQDRTPHRLAGVPGTVRGLALAHERYGRLPWRDLIQPAVRLAADGFAVNADLAEALNRVLKAQGDKVELQRVFGRPAWKAGDRLVQGDLAKTLQLIADSGPDAFYSGSVADLLVAEMGRGGGLITKADLAGYRAQVRTPLRGTYRGYEVVGAPPPSSGGTCIIEMLNILENFDVAAHERFSSQTLHLMTEAMRRAYADRAKRLGDPDFAPAGSQPAGYGKALAATIDLRKATPSAELAGDVPLRDEPENTTHFSVVDSGGMAVSNTYTLEESFGGKIVVPGAGFLLNNELGDFNPQPGITTRTGQIGTPANVAGAGKRPLSSMSPTIVLKDGRVVLVTGSPGGRTIINTVFCVLINYMDYHMSPQECVAAPRHHHQWFPDRIVPEAALARDHAAALAELRGMGHAIAPAVGRQGDAHSIFRDPRTNEWVGVADPRRAGAAARVMDR
ncbi:MAG: ggt [Phycisphaerales bacterium]|nr:ggt [Phycisphaerales bacterium]